ncbi:hypothetical protein HK096_007655, partial [Nowakowskiella sp. JEL0078]
MSVKNEELFDIISNLPYEIALRILSNIRTAKLLCRCTLVNKSWNKLANDDLLWKELCRKKWASKKHMKLELHPRVDYSNLIESLSIKEMKNILERRQVLYKLLLEKREIVARLKETRPPDSPKGSWTGK